VHDAFHVNFAMAPGLELLQRVGTGDPTSHLPTPSSCDTPIVRLRNFLDTIASFRLQPSPPPWQMGLPELRNRGDVRIVLHGRITGR
jgi:hypothetical protein